MAAACSDEPSARAWLEDATSDEPGCNLGGGFGYARGDLLDGACNGAGDQIGDNGDQNQQGQRDCGLVESELIALFGNQGLKGVSFLFDVIDIDAGSDEKVRAGDHLHVAKLGLDALAFLFEVVLRRSRLPRRPS